MLNNNIVCSKKSIQQKKTIVILGYYDCNNFGDDVFKFIYEKYIAKYENKINIKFLIVNIDIIKELPEDTIGVILGGGDVISEYYISKLLKLIANKESIPVYAIGVGIPYRVNIEQGYLDHFDYIIHRNHSDQELLLDRYCHSGGINRVRWFPDITYMLTKYTPPLPLIKMDMDAEYINLIHKTGSKKKIGVFLTRTMYNKDDVDSYNLIIGQFAKFLLSLAQKTTTTRSCCGSITQYDYDIYLIPFSDSSETQYDDRIINNDIVQQMRHLSHPNKHFNNVYLITKKPKMEEITTFFKAFYATICSRFHAHMFSFMSTVPMISLYTTRKVHTLLEHLHLEDYSIHMPTNSADYPIDLKCETLMFKWKLLVANYYTYQLNLENMNKYYETKINEFERVFTNLLYYKFKSIDYVIKDKCLNIVSYIQNKYKKTLDHSQINVPGSISVLFNDDDNGNQKTKEGIAEIISYALTGKRNSVYSWGLIEKLYKSDYSLFESVKWILTDYHLCENENNENGENRFLTNDTDCDIRKINTQTINANLLKGYHRSGWNFVLNNIDKLHNPKGILFDCYLDKTFGWDHSFFKSIGTIPYVNPWIGVLHHTPDTSYSQHNLTSIFQNQDFIDSLVHCKGLIVFSTYIKDWIDLKLTEYNIYHISVIQLFHPSDTTGSLFDYNKFISNPKKRIIQIGGWLRNSYAIYALPTPKDYTKCVLKWMGMDNYFIDEFNLQQLEDSIHHIGTGHEHCCGIRSCCIPVSSTDETTGHNINKYIVGLLNTIKNNHKSVECLDMTPNEKFDQLLTENVVFINLVDASAVNTVLESIMRNTPICVNKLPAIVEYLGKDYPLYYESYEEASAKLSNLKVIKQTHDYLQSLDKRKFTIENFMKDFTNNPIYNNL
jgi:polysaccharide pyruvyl transferase WcaK-like protein